MYSVESTRRRQKQEQERVRLGREMADAFNAANPIGTPVYAWPRFIDDKPLATHTRSSAWVLGHGEPVVSVEGLRGGISLMHIEVRQVNESGGEA